LNWRELETAAPEIAQAGAKRLVQTRIALLGTLRQDGSPRISPIEPYLSQGYLLFGAMSWSLKTSDLRRDPRCMLHSAITGPDSGEGELKLSGHAIEADDEIRNSCQGGWWLRQPAETAIVFAVDIEEAAFVSWDTEAGLMTVRRWPSRRGRAVTQRRYP
jgi:hypothetical protein